VRGHPFFSAHVTDWEALAAGAISPPWEPTVTGSLDTSLFDKEFTSMPIHSPVDPSKLPLGSVDNTTFAGFSFSEQPKLGGGL